MQPQFQLVIHDDGSLTNAECAFLVGELPGVEFVRRSDADSILEAKLRGYPRCHAFRAANIFGLKLFDTVLVGEEPTVAYCDSDVVFFRPIHGVFALPADADACFMMDATEPAAWKFSELVLRRQRFVARVNAGMYCIRRIVHDLDRLEWFLKFDLPVHLRSVHEQTAWAWLASKHRSLHWSPQQIRVMTPTFLPQENLAAGHFIGNYRDRLLPQGIELARTASDRCFVEAAFQPAQHFDWSIKLRRFLSNRSERISGEY